MFVHFLLSAMLLTGCDNFDAVQQEDSIAGYEAYLAENPDGRFSMQARNRLEELVLEQAKASGTTEAFDAYLEKFPSGVHREAAIAERETSMFNDALAKGTPAGWQAFLDAYPKKASKGRITMAKKALVASQLMENVTVSEVKIADINLAEDPTGPLNGKGFTADVTNNTDQTITSLWFRIDYLNAEGKSVGNERWPVVAPSFPVPIEEEYLEPMKPGDTRTWEWTTGDLPKTWAGEVRLIATKSSVAKQD